MLKLEQIMPTASIRGIVPDALVSVVSVQWFGSDAIELTYKEPNGRVGNTLLYRDAEARLDVAEQGRPWSFDGDGALFRVVAEANRIRLAHLFDPVLAVHTSNVEPLPHQITAVYEAMLPRQPLRFLLADDPGAGRQPGTAARHLHHRAAGPRRRAGGRAGPGNAAKRLGSEPTFERAPGRARTADLLFTKQLLYLLSYWGWPRSRSRRGCCRRGRPRAPGTSRGSFRRKRRSRRAPRSPWPGPG